MHTNQQQSVRRQRDTDTTSSSTTTTSNTNNITLLLPSDLNQLRLELRLLGTKIGSFYQQQQQPNNNQQQQQQQQPNIKEVLLETLKILPILCNKYFSGIFLFSANLHAEMRYSFLKGLTFVARDFHRRFLNFESQYFGYNITNIMNQQLAAASKNKDNNDTQQQQQQQILFATLTRNKQMLLTRAFEQLELTLDLLNDVFGKTIGRNHRLVSNPNIWKTFVDLANNYSDNNNSKNSNNKNTSSSSTSTVSTSVSSNSSAGSPTSVVVEFETVIRTLLDFVHALTHCSPTYTLMIHNALVSIAKVSWVGNNNNTNNTNNSNSTLSQASAFDCMNTFPFLSVLFQLQQGKQNEMNNNQNENNKFYTKNRTPFMFDSLEESLVEFMGTMTSGLLLYPEDDINSVIKNNIHGKATNEDAANKNNNNNNNNQSQIQQQQKPWTVPFFPPSCFLLSNQNHSIVLQQQNSTTNNNNNNNNNNAGPPTYSTTAVPRNSLPQRPSDVTEISFDAPKTFDRKIHILRSILVWLRVFTTSEFSQSNNPTTSSASSSSTYRNPFLDSSRATPVSVFYEKLSNNHNNSNNNQNGLKNSLQQQQTPPTTSINILDHLTFIYDQFIAQTNGVNNQNNADASINSNSNENHSNNNNNASSSASNQPILMNSFVQDILHRLSPSSCRKLFKIIVSVLEFIMKEISKISNVNNDEKNVSSSFSIQQGEFTFLLDQYSFAIAQVMTSLLKRQDASSIFGEFFGTCSNFLSNNNNNYSSILPPGSLPSGLSSSTSCDPNAMLISRISEFYFFGQTRALSSPGEGLTILEQLIFPQHQCSQNNLNNDDGNNSANIFTYCNNSENDISVVDQVIDLIKFVSSVACSTTAPFGMQFLKTWGQICCHEILGKISHSSNFVQPIYVSAERFSSICDSVLSPFVQFLNHQQKCSSTRKLTDDDDAVGSHNADNNFSSTNKIVFEIMFSCIEFVFTKFTPLLSSISVATETATTSTTSSSDSSHLFEGCAKLWANLFNGLSPFYSSSSSVVKTFIEKTLPSKIFPKQPREIVKSGIDLFLSRIAENCFYFVASNAGVSVLQNPENHADDVALTSLKRSASGITTSSSGATTNDSSLPQQQKGGSNSAKGSSSIGSNTNNNNNNITILPLQQQQEEQKQQKMLSSGIGFSQIELALVLSEKIASASSLNHQHQQLIAHLAMFCFDSDFLLRNENLSNNLNSFDFENNNNNDNLSEQQIALLKNRLLRSINLLASSVTKFVSKNTLHQDEISFFIRTYVSSVVLNNFMNLFSYSSSNNNILTSAVINQENNIIFPSSSSSQSNFSICTKIASLLYDSITESEICKLLSQSSTSPISSLFVGRIIAELFCIHHNNNRSDEKKSSSPASFFFDQIVDFEFPSIRNYSNNSNIPKFNEALVRWIESWNFSENNSDSSSGVSVLLNFVSALSNILIHTDSDVSPWLNKIYEQVVSVPASSSNNKQNTTLTPFSASTTQQTSNFWFEKTDPQVLLLYLKTFSRNTFVSNMQNNNKLDSPGKAAKILSTPGINNNNHIPLFTSASFFIDRPISYSVSTSSSSSTSPLQQPISPLTLKLNFFHSLSLKQFVSLALATARQRFCNNNSFSAEVAAQNFLLSSKESVSMLFPPSVLFATSSPSSMSSSSGGTNSNKLGTTPSLSNNNANNKHSPQSGRFANSKMMMMPNASPPIFSLGTSGNLPPNTNMQNFSFPIFVEEFGHGFLEKIAAASSSSSSSSFSSSSSICEMISCIKQLKTSGTLLSRVFLKGVAAAACQTIFSKCSQIETSLNAKNQTSSATNVSGMITNLVTTDAKCRVSITFLRSFLDIFALHIVGKTSYDWFSSSERELQSELDGINNASNHHQHFSEDLYSSLSVNSAHRNVIMSLTAKSNLENNNLAASSIATVLYLFRVFPSILIEYLETPKETIALSDDDDESTAASVDEDDATTGKNSKKKNTKKTTAKTNNNINSTSSSSTTNASSKLFPGVLLGIKLIADVPWTFPDKSVLQLIASFTNEFVVPLSAMYSQRLNDDPVQEFYSNIFDGAAQDDAQQNQQQQQQNQNINNPNFFNFNHSNFHTTVTGKLYGVLFTAPAILSELCVEASTEFFVANNPLSSSTTTTNNNTNTNTNTLLSLTKDNIQEKFSSRMAVAFGHNFALLSTNVEVHVPLVFAQTIDRVTRRTICFGPTSPEKFAELFDAQLNIVSAAIHSAMSVITISAGSATKQYKKAGSTLSALNDVCRVFAKHVVDEIQECIHHPHHQQQPFSGSNSGPKLLYVETSVANFGARGRQQLLMPMTLGNAAAAFVDVVCHQIGLNESKKDIHKANNNNNNSNNNNNNNNILPASMNSRKNNNINNVKNNNHNNNNSSEKSSTSAFLAQTTQIIDFAMNPTIPLATTFNNSLSLDDVSPITGARRTATCIALTGLTLLIRMLGEQVRIFASRVPEMIDHVLKGFSKHNNNSNYDVEIRVCWLWKNLVFATRTLGYDDDFRKTSWMSWLLHMIDTCRRVDSCLKPNSSCRKFMLDAIRELLSSIQMKELDCIGALFGQCHSIVRQAHREVKQMQQQQQQAATSKTSLTASMMQNKNQTLFNPATNNSSNKDDPILFLHPRTVLGFSVLHLMTNSSQTSIAQKLLSLGLANYLRVRSTSIYSSSNAVSNQQQQQQQQTSLLFPNPPPSIFQQVTTNPTKFSHPFDDGTEMFIMRSVIVSLNNNNVKQNNISSSSSSSTGKDAASSSSSSSNSNNQSSDPFRNVIFSPAELHLRSFTLLHQLVKLLLQTCHGAPNIHALECIGIISADKVLATDTTLVAALAAGATGGGNFVGLNQLDIANLVFFGDESCSPFSVVGPSASSSSSSNISTSSGSNGANTSNAISSTSHTTQRNGWRSALQHHQQLPPLGSSHSLAQQHRTRLLNNNNSSNNNNNSANSGNNTNSSSILGLLPQPIYNLEDWSGSPSENLSVSDILLLPLRPEKFKRWDELGRYCLELCIDSLEGNADKEQHDAAAFAAQDLLRILSNCSRKLLGRRELDSFSTTISNNSQANNSNIQSNNNNNNNQVSSSLDQDVAAASASSSSGVAGGLSETELMNNDWFSTLPKWTRTVLLKFTEENYKNILMRKPKEPPYFSPGQDYKTWITTWFGQLVYRTCDVEFGKNIHLQAEADSEPNSIGAGSYHTAVSAAPTGLPVPVRGCATYATTLSNNNMTVLGAPYQTKIFSAMRFLGKTDHSVALTLLPYVAAHVVIFASPQDVESVRLEIDNVLSYALGELSEIHQKQQQNNNNQNYNNNGNNNNTNTQTTKNNKDSQVPASSTNTTTTSSVTNNNNNPSSSTSDVTTTTFKSEQQERLRQRAEEVSLHLAAIFQVMDATDLLAEDLYYCARRERQEGRVEVQNSKTATSGGGGGGAAQRKQFISTANDACCRYCISNYWLATNRCRRFVSSVSNHRLGRAALLIGNSARALRYLESQDHLPSLASVITKGYFRQLCTPQQMQLASNSNYLSFLHETFASVDDVDSAKSVFNAARMPVGDSALAEFRHGDWQSALRLCEVAMQQKENQRNGSNVLSIVGEDGAPSGNNNNNNQDENSQPNFEHADVSLRCMRELGYYSTMAKTASDNMLVKQKQSNSTKSMFDQLRNKNSSKNNSNSAKQKETFQRHLLDAQWRMANWSDSAFSSTSTMNYSYYYTTYSSISDSGNNNNIIISENGNISSHQSPTSLSPLTSSPLLMNFPSQMKMNSSNSGNIQQQLHQKQQAFSPTSKNNQNNNNNTSSFNQNIDDTYIARAMSQMKNVVDVIFAINNNNNASCDKISPSPMKTATNIISSLRSTLQRGRFEMLASLRKNQQESQINLYDDLVTLHLLEDVQIFTDHIENFHRQSQNQQFLPTSSSSTSTSSTIFEQKRKFSTNLAMHLDRRLQSIDARFCERILSAHRSMYRALDDEERYAQLWLAQAETLRNFGQLDAARSAVSQAIASSERSLVNIKINQERSFNFRQQQYEMLSSSTTNANSKIPASKSSVIKNPALVVFEQQQRIATSFEGIVSEIEEELKNIYWRGKLLDTQLLHDSPSEQGQAEAAAEQLLRYVAVCKNPQFFMNNNNNTNNNAAKSSSTNPKLLNSSTFADAAENNNANYFVSLSANAACSSSSSSSFSITSICDKPPREIASDMLLLSAQWADEKRLVHPRDLIERLLQAAQYNENSEAIHHVLALHYDKMASQLRSDLTDAISAQALATSGMISSNGSANKQNSNNNNNVQINLPKDQLVMLATYAFECMRHYNQALRLSVQNAYLALPRMITIWLDTTLFFASIAGTTAIGGADHHQGGAMMNFLANRMNPHLVKTASDCLNGMSQQAKLCLEHPTSGVPTTVLIAALSQLVSRVGHSDKKTNELILSLLLRLMHSFPQQVMWAIAGPESSALGKNKGALIRGYVIEKYAMSGQEARQFATQTKQITQLLSKVCDLDSKHFMSGQKLNSLPDVKIVTNQVLKTCKWVLPLCSTLTPTLSSAALIMTNNNLNNNNNHNSISNNNNNNQGQPVAPVFPDVPIIDHFGDEVVVMPSLQKPKRIAIYDQTGTRHFFLFKTKDEPRKDMRLLELCGMINTLFQTDEECRRRRLALRRYQVTPLGDESGMIEWMPNVAPIRKIVEEGWTSNGDGMKTSVLKAISDKCEKGQVRRENAFLEHIFPNFPPRLHLWFHQLAVYPPKWYEARRRYTVSLAAWSMVGHELGLGDRHGENLLLDTQSGEISHVDFACLFDKGESLGVVEVARFRLTPNLIDGLGVTGHHGAFEKNCELTIGICMKHKEKIMGILDTFLYDPLVEWSNANSKHQQLQMSMNSNINNNNVAVGGWINEPKYLLARVRRRLDGNTDLFTDKPQWQQTLQQEEARYLQNGVGSASSTSGGNDTIGMVLQNNNNNGNNNNNNNNSNNYYGSYLNNGLTQLSPQGQVRALIESASSIQVLSRMYIWWMAWI